MLNTFIKKNVEFYDYTFKLGSLYSNVIEYRLETTHIPFDELSNAIQK